MVYPLGVGENVLDVEDDLLHMNMSKNGDLCYKKRWEKGRI